MDLMKRLLFLILLAVTASAQTTLNGTLTSGPAVARPICSATYNATTLNQGDVYHDTDDANAWKCNDGSWVAFTGAGASSPISSPSPFVFNTDLQLKGPNPS